MSEPQILEQELRVLNEYPGSHHYWNTYSLTRLYCPNCGARGLWVALVGDYDAGESHVCTQCEHWFNSHGISWIDPKYDKNMPGILDQLKSGVVNEPTTQKGG